MNEAIIINKILYALGKNRIKNMQYIRDRRINLEINKSDLKEVASNLKNIGFHHISTITSLEVSDMIELIYHLSDDSNIVNLRFSTKLNEMDIPTLTDIFPGVELYEREIHEMIGINFINHPILTNLILPEHWPKNSFPLRKSKSEIIRDEDGMDTNNKKQEEGSLDWL